MDINTYFEYEINKELKECLQANFKLIINCIHEEITPLEGQVNIVCCDTELITELNESHRPGKTGPTDVLTFTYYSDESSFLAEDLLGEIFICIPIAQNQAKNAEEENWSFQMEMYKLFIHGILHLRGYDHIKDEDYRVMKLIEDKVMISFLNKQKTRIK